MGLTNINKLLSAWSGTRVKAFTLTELLIAVTLAGMVIVAVSSMDITSRKFFGAASDEAMVQDEAKIAMEHIVKYVQLGIGDFTNPDTTPPTADNNSRGFFILDTDGNLVNSGPRLQVKIDGFNGRPADGKFDSDDDNDALVEYEYRGQPDYHIRFYPDVSDPALDRDDPDNYEVLTKNIIYAVEFKNIDDSSNQLPPNQVRVVITVRKDPAVNPGPKNPQTILTSDIVLRAMSAN